MDRILEFMFFFVHSRRALTALFFGIVFFIGINIVGDTLVSRINGSGVMAVFFERVAEILGHRYDRLAWIALFSFLFLAVKLSISDKKRFLGTF
ncbi:hypothetical protein [uncultured Amphritea sp.]|uniref:hypothetical protein n=1 Tax=uncultured Amphritea sp. TaxID=981605 RepID=UPI0026045210|nr:hypothetical protein [uncultured Amphritea sp.]